MSYQGGLRRLAMVCGMLAICAAPSYAQPATTFYVYDDLGRIAKVVDIATGACAVYEYDAVGNVLSVGRDSSCLAAPSVTGISPSATQNCFIVSGQNLLGATVRSDMPGVLVTSLAATATSVNFCLSTPAPVCTLSGTVTVDTPGGSGAALPVTITGGNQWSGAVELVDAIGTANRSDRFCFALPAPQHVVIQATSTSFDPCLRVTNADGSPVTGGLSCTFPAARLDLTLPAGSYLVDASDNGNNQVGAYTLIYEPIVAATAAPLTPGVALIELVAPAGDLDLFRFTLTTPTRVILQGTSSEVNPCVRILTGAGDPAVAAGTACGFPAARLDVVLPAGTFFVEVSDNGNNQSGDYTLLYEPLDPATAVTLVPDVPASATVAPVGDLDLYTFTLTAPTRVVLQATSTTIASCLRILTRAGDQPVTGGTACGFPAARLDLVLPVGTFFVEISDNGDNQSGNYTLLYEPVEPATAVTLVADVPASATVAPVGDLDLYTFTLTAPTRVVLQATSTTIASCLRILTAAGDQPVTGGTACGFPAARLAIVLPAGVYFVELSANGSNQSGAYLLLYEPFIPALASALLADVAVSDALTPVGDVDLFTFTIDAPTRVILQTASLDVDTCIRVWRGLDGPTATPAPQCGFPTARLDLTLDAGLYFVELSDNGSNGSGAYTLLYEPIVTATAVTLSADVPSSDTISPNGDLDLYTFTLAASTRVILQAASGALNSCLRLLTAAGDPPVAGGTTCDFPTRLDLVLGPGRYFVEVSASGYNQAGPYTVIFEPVVVENAVALSPSVPIGESLTPPGDLDLYTFTLPVSGRVVLQATSNALVPCIRLLTGAAGQPLPETALCSFPTARLEQELTAGTYFVEVSTIVSVGAYTLTMESDVTGLPSITIEATDATASEIGLDPGAFTVTRSGSTAASLAVNYTVAGTATPSVDYGNIGTTVIIPAGQASQVVQIAPFPDFEQEPTETIVVTLTAGNYTIAAPNTATVTIADDGAPTVVSVFTTTPAIFETDGKPGRFTVFRSGPLNASLTVNFALTGTATQGIDYPSVGTSIVMPAGETVADVTIAPVADALLEGEETVTLTLAPGNYTIAQGGGTVSLTIADAPPATSVLVLASLPTAFEDGSTPGIFTVLRIGSTADSLTVNIEWSGSATRGVDYEQVETSVVIPAGDSSASVVITPVSDVQAEGQETVTLTIAPGAYTIAGGVGSATISILDGAERNLVYVVATDPQASETGQNAGTLLILRTGIDDAPLTVTYQVAGTAINGTDYQSIPSSVFIPAGESFALVTIRPIADTLTEGEETVTLTITPGIGYEVVDILRTATVTIADSGP